MNAPTSKAWWRAAYGANWLIILWFWWSGSGELLGQGLVPALVALGRLAGLTAAYCILVQFFFMGRTPWLERVFGLDKLARIHHTNGKWGLLLLLVHPVLLTIGYAQMSGVSLGDQFISFLVDYEHVAAAALGLGMFIVVVVSSVYIVRSGLRYEWWYLVHLLAYLAVYASFGHQLANGTDLVASRLFYGYWILLYTVVFANHLLFRFARPLYRSWRHGFYVSRVVRENYNTVSLYLGGRQLDQFPVEPGQFMILRFLTKRLWWQAHPFSLSRPFDGQELRVTIKASGDFTKNIDQIPVGTKLIIDGPYGVFTEAHSQLHNVLFIAGGIGITPIRSLMEQMVRRGKNVALLYSNRAARDIVFKDELAQLPAPVTHVLSDLEGPLDASKIERLVPDVARREIFLCGPPPMMDAMIAALTTLGVPRQRIHFERFSLP